MSAVLVTIGPEATVSAAARLMREQGVSWLPVLADGRVVGVLGRSDLLAVFLRSDAAISAEIEQEVLADMLATDPSRVAVEVTDGVITLTGELDTRIDAEVAAAYTHRLPNAREARGAPRPRSVRRPRRRRPQHDAGQRDRRAADPVSDIVVLAREAEGHLIEHGGQGVGEFGRDEPGPHRRGRMRRHLRRGDVERIVTETRSRRLRNVDQRWFADLQFRATPPPWSARHLTSDAAECRRGRTHDVGFTALHRPVLALHHDVLLVEMVSVGPSSAPSWTVSSPGSVL